MADLAERLMTAAFDASCPAKDRPYFTEDELRAERADARATVVAVLQVLAADLLTNEDAACDYGAVRIPELVTQIAGAR